MDKLEHIVKGCIHQEAKYQRILYDRYRGFALKVVFRYIYRYDRAVDVVTDGFVKAFTYFANFRVGEEYDLEKLLMGWLKRIMINCSIDELRRTNMLPEIGGVPEDVWEISNANDNADKLILYKDLISLIKELPPNYRVVFNLYVFDGCSHSEIAEMMNISVSTSRSSLSRAKTILQNLIKNMEQGKACRI